jgi:hypothetical protein
MRSETKTPKRTSRHRETLHPPIPAADDCVLFLWSTVPLLDDAIEVMKAWASNTKPQ